MPNRLLALLSFLWLILGGCGGPVAPTPAPGTTVIAVVGALHGQHRRSETYSLDILDQAVRQFAPDMVLVELPPDRFATAAKNFRQFGEVRESRADDFPELTEVVFPLSEERGFAMVPVAAWTAQIAADRRSRLAAIEQDPGRAEEWDQYQAAIRDYRRKVAGRTDDPIFVHSDRYDEAVRTRQQVYQSLFGEELGAGGWDEINRAHLSLISTALDSVSGEGKRVLILFGAWHKYKIKDALAQRDDVQLYKAASLF